MFTLSPADPLSADFSARIGTEIAHYLDRRAAALAEIGPQTAPLIELAAAFTAGGKRVRPAFCCWGYAAATGETQMPPQLMEAAASLDLLHVAALVHDDVMDDSAIRRGLPAAHVQLADWHREAARRGTAAAFGRAGAILLGDLLLLWSAEMLLGCGAPAERLFAALPLAASVREEVNAGQFLDITAQTRSALDARNDLASVTEQISQVVEYKTARYTVIRPLQIGAALGGGSPELLAALARFGSPLGRAFQFRDDLLGVFGDASVTGKPAGDDLREGKLTVLIAKAMAGASDTDAAELSGLLGRELSPSELVRAQQIITESGALAATEAEIALGASEAVAALNGIDLPTPAATGLQKLVTLMVDRSA